MGEWTLGLKFRSLRVNDADWWTEIENDPEAAKYAIGVYPRTEHDIREFLQKELEEGKRKHIVAELEGEPAGDVSVQPGIGRYRHVAWLGIAVRRQHWGKGVGSGLMKEAVGLAKELGCRKLMLGTTEGNARAIRLYKKFRFETEAYEDEEAYIEGSWKKDYIMGLELAPCEPKFEQPLWTLPSRVGAKVPEPIHADINIRQLMNRDLGEVNRIQNCPESTKSSYRIPPVSKEETRRWYEGLKSTEGRYCLACFKDDRLLGYLSFRARHFPHPNLRMKNEEVIVDVNQRPFETAIVLITAIKGFMERYGYRRIFAYVPETSAPIVTALEYHGFRKTGAMRSYFFIDGYYVNVALYGYP